MAMPLRDLTLIPAGERLTVTENNVVRPQTTRRDDVSEVRKSLDSFAVEAPTPVEAPVAQMDSTPSEPAATPQASAPADFDG